MPLKQTQQFYEAVKNSSRILIVIGRDNNLDSLTSGLALYLLFKKLGKNRQFFVPNRYNLENLNFLPEIKNISNELSDLRKSIIKLDLNDKKLKYFDYFIDKNNQLKLTVLLDQGEIKKEDIKTLYTEYAFNLIVTINAPDLEALGEIYLQNTDFFYQTPIINIDHKTKNEHFGHYNYINVTATGSCEIIFDLIQEINPNLIDEEIATCLLTGMISQTNSFKTPQVTPKSLEIASQLINNGAHRDTIIKNLFHTKSVKTLKLWGRVLQKLQTNKTGTLAWVKISKIDFQKTQTTKADLYDLIDNLIDNIPTVKTSIIFLEENNRLQALIKSNQKNNLLERLKNYTLTDHESFISLFINKKQAPTLLKIILDTTRQ